MYRVIVCINHILQNIYVPFRIVCSEVHPQASLQCSIEPFNHRCLGVTIRGEVVYTLILEQLADILIEKLLSPIGL